MLNCEKINLKKGNKGETVKEAQNKLKQLGFYQGKIDGDYGDMTVDAVKKYQRTQHLLEDGIIGPVTCKVLNNTQTNSTAKKEEKNEGPNIVFILILFAIIFGFIECAVWALIVSAIITSLTSNILWLLSYCFGYCLGIYIGLLIEEKIALNNQHEIDYKE